ncbi:MAG: ATP-binding protein [Verrucomicrobiota bacterium JB023]|nr:ATP-binding protein [Verrucomicrobiota bacterium JB023]
MPAPSVIVAILALLSTGVALYLWQRERILLQKTRKICHEDSKRQKKLMRREQNRMLNALADAFLLVDSNGIIRFANEPASDLVAGRLLLKRNFKEVFLDDRLTTALEESLRTGKSAVHHTVLPQHASPRGPAERRGETAWVIDAAPLDRNSPKKITRVIIRDVTTEHQTEQVRKDFVANASHELRTPLSIINGYLENLLEDDDDLDPEFLKRALKVMQKHGERIARIVEDMLVISKLESGEASALNLEPFLFQSCVTDVLERLEPVFHAQNAESKVILDDADLTLVGDRFYWTQVLFNLVENALKQNPSSSLKVEIGAKKLDSGEIHIWVADDGVGIPSADLPFIFRRFYRVEKHHTHDQNEIKGTGLGLSIVRRAVEAHFGKVSVSSKPGQRTSFDIILPTEEAAKQAASQAASKQSDAGRLEEALA